MSIEHPMPTTNPLALDILKRIPSSLKNIREESINFENQVIRNPSVFTGREDEVANIARDGLDKLRQNTDIYSVYARGDILRGLAAINHPATQSVIAESVLDKEEQVANAAIRLLTKAKEIYSETIVRLWQQETVKTKLLSIIEQNKTGGMHNGKTIPEVETILLEMLGKDFNIREHKRAAMIASLLYERSNGNISPALRHESANFLSSEIEKAVTQLAERSAFPLFIENFISANFNTAKSFDIARMEIAIPQNAISEQEEMAAALNKLEPSSLAEAKYRGLLALAKMRARSILQTRVAEEKKQEEQRKAILQQEEARVNQQQAILKQQEELARAQSIQQKISKEKSLATQALVSFPHLKEN